MLVLLHTHTMTESQSTRVYFIASHHGSGSNRQKDNLQTKGCRRIILNGMLSTNTCYKEWVLLITDLLQNLDLSIDEIPTVYLVHCSTLPHKGGLLRFTSLKLPSVQIYRGFLVNQTLCTKVGFPIGRAMQQVVIQSFFTSQILNTSSHHHSQSGWSQL